MNSARGTYRPGSTGSPRSGRKHGGAGGGAHTTLWPRSKKNGFSDCALHHWRPFFMRSCNRIPQWMSFLSQTPKCPEFDTPSTRQHGTVLGGGSIRRAPPTGRGYTDTTWLPCSEHEPRAGELKGVAHCDGRREMPCDIDRSRQNWCITIGVGSPNNLGGGRWNICLTFVPFKCFGHFLPPILAQYQSEDHRL